MRAIDETSSARKPSCTLERLPTVALAFATAAYIYIYMCVRACVRARVCVCARAYVRAFARVCVYTDTPQAFAEGKL